MAPCSPFFGSLTVLFLCLAPTAYSTSTVQEICSAHRNPSFCEFFLKGEVGAKVENITEFALDVVHKNASCTQKTIQSLMEGTREIRLLQHYYTCKENYDGVLKSIADAQRAFHNGNLVLVQTSAAAILGFVDDCQSSEAPGFDPSTALQQSNENIGNISLLIVISSNILQKVIKHSA